MRKRPSAGEKPRHDPVAAVWNIIDSVTFNSRFFQSIKDANEFSKKLPAKTPQESRTIYFNEYLENRLWQKWGEYLQDRDFRQDDYALLFDEAGAVLSLVYLIEDRTRHLERSIGIKRFIAKAVWSVFQSIPVDAHDQDTPTWSAVYQMTPREASVVMRSVQNYCRRHMDRHSAPTKSTGACYDASHYKIKHGIQPGTLGKARRDKRISGEKRNGRWFYLLSEVRGLWPDAFEEDDETARNATKRD